MKRKIFTIAINLIALVSLGQIDVQDTLKLNNNYIGYTELTENGVVNIVIKKPLEIDQIIKVKGLDYSKRYNNARRENLSFDFELPSEYLVQSGIYRNQALKIKLITSLTGIGATIIGSYIASQSNDVNDNLRNGLIIGGAGFVTAGVGFGISFNHNLKANNLFKIGAQKFKSHGL